MMTIRLDDGTPDGTVVRGPIHAVRELLDLIDERNRYERERSGNSVDAIAGRAVDSDRRVVRAE